MLVVTEDLALVSCHSKSASHSERDCIQGSTPVITGTSCDDPRRTCEAHSSRFAEFRKGRIGRMRTRCSDHSPAWISEVVDRLVSAWPTLKSELATWRPAALHIMQLLCKGLAEETPKLCCQFSTGIGLADDLAHPDLAFWGLSVWSCFA